MTFVEPTIDFSSQTYFDVHFKPDIIVGPSILEYLQDYFARHNGTVEAILTILQVEKSVVALLKVNSLFCS